MKVMKSTFFHVGVNRTMAKKYGLQEPQVKSDGSIPYVPLPDHHDPNFEDLTYGDPFGRLLRFEKGDIAFFIESGTVSKDDWGYYLVAFFVIESVYIRRNGILYSATDKGSWSRDISPDHVNRISRNAHEKRGDTDYAMILGCKETSKLLFQYPLRVSNAQDAQLGVKEILRLPPNQPTRGYWFKKWLSNNATVKMLSSVLFKTQERVPKVCPRCTGDMKIVTFDNIPYYLCTGCDFQMRAAI